jgi:hypothetical protein
MGYAMKSAEKPTDVSEECVASTFMIKEYAKREEGIEQNVR